MRNRCIQYIYPTKNKRHDLSMSIFKKITFCILYKINKCDITLNFT